VRKPFNARRLLRPLLSGIAILCLASILGNAQRYSFREYTQGLSNLNIACLAQDHTGYLWVGTQNGLYRYDGAQFLSFGPAQGLPERMIQSLFVGVDGTLWVATTTGIYFEQKSGHFAEVHPPAPVSQFLQRSGTVFAANQAGAVVTITRDGAFLLRRTQPEQWTADRMHLEGSLWSVAFDAKGSLWYGCDSDLCKLTDGKTTRMGAQLGLPEENWTNLLVTRDGNLWLRGKMHVGEIELGTGRFTLRDLPGTNAPESYPTLAEDAQGRLLTAKGSSLGLWEKGHWRMVTEANGLSRFEVQDLFVDREGSVWISEVGHGLKRWVGQDRWEGYTAAGGLSDDLIWSAMRDQKGRLWIGSESGLDWLPAGSQTPKTWHQPGVMVSRAGALAKTADGAIWVGSAAGSLLRIDGNTLVGKQWKLPEVYDVVADAQGHVWAASNAGLYEVDANGKGTAPALVDVPVFGNVRQRFSDLCIDDKDRLWAAADEGMFIRDGSGWHRIDLGSSGATPDVITVDQKGDLWAGGASQELMKLRIVNYRVVETTHITQPPLLSQQVVSLMADHRGWIWIGQDAGLTMFDGHAWHSYTQDDGLIWNDTDSYALAEDTDGSMWIGTSGGLSHLISPADAAAGSPQAPALSQVAYGDKILENGTSTSWSSNPLNISMALLSFKGTQDAGIRYRLVGSSNPDWVETRNMEVHYGNLEPGSYRFEVAQIDEAGHPISPTAVYAFRITPRWWQTTGLRVGVVVFVTVMIFALWRHRIAQLLRQKKHLETAVKLRTVDLEREKGELVKTKEQMRHFAEHDDLTGLWNHRIIVERLRIEVDRSRREGLPLSIILADLDFFKRINDTFGHPAGDQVLKEASATFQRMVRTYDWVGRYGGEEFLLILPGSGFMHARQRAEELRLAIQTARVEEGETVIPLTASFGVASGFPTSHEELIREADAALYRAKNSGRNCVVATEVDTRRVARHAS
jgi:diguanylate cyclase (GGDEF)-like protein